MSDKYIEEMDVRMDTAEFASNLRQRRQEKAALDCMEESMLADAICTGLGDLISDLRSDETQSSLALLPQAREIKRMADSLRNRLQQLPKKYATSKKDGK